MAGEVRHHRADIRGVSETERCIKFSLLNLIHLYMRGDPRGLPLVQGIVKGFYKSAVMRVDATSGLFLFWVMHQRVHDPRKRLRLPCLNPHFHPFVYS